MNIPDNEQIHNIHISISICLKQKFSNCGMLMAQVQLVVLDFSADLVVRGERNTWTSV